MSEETDGELVALCLAGNREAFGRIVARYQSLVCSLAYSATGSLTQSEDLAQETFVIAWRGLRGLREPARLRTWLCGIVRNRIGRALRRDEHEPSHKAEPLESAAETPADEPWPAERAITREEEAILWRALERIPETYREPLVLFYREGQSVEKTAQALELSEDAVKQRLFRGRKLLAEEVAAFVEGALRHTAPGAGFTSAVLALLPMAMASAGAGATGAMAAKAGAAAKTAVSAGLLGAVLGPLIGILGGWYGARASIRNTRSPRERQFVVRQTWLATACVTGFVLALCGLTVFGRPLARSRPVAFGLVTAALVIAYSAGLWIWIARANRRQRQIQIEDGTFAAVPPPLSLAAQRRQIRGAAYGGIGGSTVGALAWLLALAWQTGDWLAVSLVVLVGAAVCFWGIRAFLREPARRFDILWRVAAVLGVFTLALFNLRWRLWAPALAHPGIPVARVALGVNAGLIVLYLALVLGFWWAGRRLRSTVYPQPLK